MIKDMNVNISHAFYYPSGVFAKGEDFLSRVKKLFGSVTVYDENLETDDPNVKDMQIAQKFLRGGGQTYKVYRAFLNDFRLGKEGDGPERFCTMCSYFEESDIISLSFHYEMKGISSDQVIGIRQSGVHAGYEYGDGTLSCSALATKIRSALGLPEHAESSIMIEVTKFGDYDSLEKIEAEHGKLLYGLLSGDEGYNFVPEEMVRERLKLSWGSRDFMRIYACKQAFLFINLLRTPHQKEYLERQIEFGTATYGGCNPYFFMEECPLTVNHGILFSVEFAMVLKALVNEVLVFQTQRRKRSHVSYYRRIRETRDFRRKIIKVLEKVEQTQIAEIGELSSVLLNSQHIAPIVEEVKYLLELLEGDLSLIYSERNNTLVTVLTVLGLLLAAWQVWLAL